VSPSRFQAYAGKFARWAGGSADRRWNLCALFVFLAATVSVFHGLSRHGFTEVVPAFVPKHTYVHEKPHPGGPFVAADQRFTVWLVSRNARTLLTHPWRLFDGEHCHPARRTLALTDPAITAGLLGTPAWAASRDPVATFNFVWLVITWLAALSTYLLIREWTGVPAAGIVAGLLHAFHVVKLWDVAHPYIDDGSWTVLALLFATRWLEGGRWRDAVGFAACAALQIGTSFYALLAGLLVSLPVGVWLLLRFGVGRLRPAQCLMVLAWVAVAMLVVFGPFLQWKSEGVLDSRSFQQHQAWSAYLPGRNLFPGWTLLALAACAFALGRERAVGALRGNPRWALLLGALLTLAIATGGSSGEARLAQALGEPPPFPLPNLYAFLAGGIPGLDVVRVPAAIDSGFHLALCLLAGLGAAGLIRGVGTRFRVWAAVALLLVSFGDQLRPRTLGLEPRLEYAWFRVRPEETTLGFFRELEARGDRGPLFEVPTDHTPWAASAAILLTGYHGRRTSWCFGSFHPPIADRVRALGPEMPAADAVEELRGMGFRSVLVHHPTRLQAPLRERFRAFSRRHPGLLRPLHETPSLSAYSIAPR
jgi:hypothetical protein